MAPDDVGKLVKLALAGLIDCLIALHVHVAVILHSSAGRNQPPHDHVFLQATKVVNATGNGSFRKYARGLLERCGGDEGVGRKRQRAGVASMRREARSVRGIAPGCYGPNPALARAPQRGAREAAQQRGPAARVRADDDRDPALRDGQPWAGPEIDPAPWRPSTSGGGGRGRLLSAAQAASATAPPSPSTDPPTAQLLP